MATGRFCKCWLVALWMCAGLCGLASAAPREDHEWLSTDTIDNFHEKNTTKLVGLIGGDAYDSVSGTLKTRMPDHKLVGVCRGSFHKAGDTDVALALLNPRDNDLVYAVATRRAKYKDFLVVSRGKIGVNANGIFSPWADVTCESWTSLKRILANYARASGASGSDLRPVNQLDAICIVPPASVPSYACYSLSDRRGKFRPIGGWFND